MPRGIYPRTKKRKLTDQNPQPTDDANNTQTLPWSSALPVLDPASAPASNTHVTNQHAWPASNTAASHAGSQPYAVVDLPSPSPTNEPSPTSASEHSQGRADTQSTATVEETAAALPAAPENFPGQPLGGQIGDVAQQIPVHQPHQPNARRIPLQHVMLHAATIVRERASGSEPMTPEEKARYSTLYAACVNADLFFLMIHQYYSCWLINKPRVYAHFRLSVLNINRAFAQLRVMFKDEERISPPHRLWFSEFPGFSENVYCVPQMQSQIQDFLLAFSIKWPELMKDSQAQMMPLMECHIRERLKCPSLTIANKLFIHSRRIIGVPDNQFTNEATRLFNMDQKLERMYEELNEPVADVAEARRSMRLSYQHTIENIRQQMQAASQAAPPTGHPNQEFPAQPLINNNSVNSTNSTPQQQQQQYHHHRLSLFSSESSQYPLQPQPQPQPQLLQTRPPRGRQIEAQIQSQCRSQTNLSATSQQTLQQVPQPLPQPSPQQLPQQQIYLQQQILPHQQVLPRQQNPQQVSVLQPPASASGQPILPGPGFPEQSPSSGLQYPALAPKSPRQSIQGSQALLSPVNPPLPAEPQRAMPQQQPGPWHIQQPDDAQNTQHLHRSPQATLLQSQNLQIPLFQIQSNARHENMHLLVSQPNDSAPLSPQPYQQNIEPAQALQAPSPAFQILQGSDASQEAQIPRGSQIDQGPPPITISQRPQEPQTVIVPLTAQRSQVALTPQALRIHQSPVQIMQASQTHHTQSQQQPHLQNSASQTSRTPTPNRYSRQFTIRETPPTEYPSSPHDWTSLQTGLHLTHLRSPRRVSSSPGPGSGKNRYYQFFSRFVVEPTEMKPHMGVSELEFVIEQEDLSRRPVTSEPSELPVGELPMMVPVSRHFNHSQRYRLRMCERRKLSDDEETSFDTAEWAISRTHWPSYIFLSLNGEIVSPLLKQHYHNDLPIELTNSLVKGANKVKVHLPSFPQNIKKNIAYFMAVELIVTLDHGSTRALVFSAPHISMDQTKTEINRRLQLDTDEIIINSDTLTVAVTDSFSSKLFDVPVRGRNCRHLECIDLENWLNSRPSKPSPEAGEPTTVDSWGCPICGEDARPGNLQIDDYFVYIRDKLLEERRGNVKKIQITIDGTWKAVGVADENTTSDKDDVN
ncbi:hypothetical protein M441DRAFT_83451 [Trichoderma asperellum CBS 433.97]|uniref:Uncharacterized protein n=1 Tax=Trichoderma asperellum (strain ATCC 204424 / CBS 433.97 / NBRC 101777) TaxID=1042311 RepID=A0A2T3YWB3_TRIA4|nr:hypothetical protein M441DRAFT_83451 [Trichoderma asperellum CBS 433.97]PTB36820.1 hypothetical protein M441DRAFT_83451 [Trichoderma asperellum CBS 433.97]